MRIDVVAIGKIKERYIEQAIDDYSRRLSRYCKLSVRTALEEPFSDRDSEARRAQLRVIEGGRLLNLVRPGSYVIASDLAGREVTSEELSALIAGLASSGRSDITFLIGGPTGYAPEVLTRADDRIRFSRMTFPHQLMRVILLEQIYRAFKIDRNEPYHY
ncbi:MAG TPA: 23S rRNA (pseudouridine(1915)-N(3))-methyltransferase RlmH [Bacillota bacterium]|jgi:23S rRNA (pseudouridine1915-N3)-methyltransferase|nr:23S rRNA (pseudouridine(1915)-N(3))-methyltransferase RlmH [Bacillota bacterium]